MSNIAYQLALTCGVDREKVSSVSMQVIDLTPDATSPEAVLAALDKSGLKPADLRSKAVLAIAGDVERALMVWSALVGFAGRRIDVVSPKNQLRIEDLWKAANNLHDAGKPEVRIEDIQVGGASRDDMPWLELGSNPVRELAPEIVSVIRYARRVRFVPNSDLLQAFAELVAVAGIRGRDGSDRLPSLVAGNEVADPEAIVGVPLDALREAGRVARTEAQKGDDTPLVEKVEQTERELTLCKADERPIEETLVLLGEHSHGDMWHCPRRWRHTNGDATPSMKLAEGKIKCPRCDKERKGSLALVIDTLSVTPDEAAELLLGPDEAWTEWVTVRECDKVEEPA